MKEEFEMVGYVLRERNGGWGCIKGRMWNFGSFWLVWFRLMCGVGVEFLGGVNVLEM